MCRPRNKLISYAGLWRTRLFEIVKNKKNFKFSPYNRDQFRSLTYSSKLRDGTLRKNSPLCHGNMESSHPLPRLKKCNTIVGNSQIRYSTYF